MIHVGTSGYSYPHWRGILYPERLPVSRWLERYASVFSTVELNATFYKLPTVRAIARWRATTPEGFVFACKGSQYLTHRKRLRDAGEGLRRYFELIDALGEKLGPVLFQLPPQMSRPDTDRLAAFLAELPPGHLYAFEFRHPAWYTAEVCALLDAYGIAFCEHDLLPMGPPRRTGTFRYLRFHGALAKYEGRYGKAALLPVAADLLRTESQGVDAWVYFNNDTHGHALFDALDLAELLELPMAKPLASALHVGEMEAASPG